MRAKTKKILKKWIFRIVCVFMVCLLLVINIRRLNNNTFSNYEKAFEYGTIDEKREVIEPIITAIFYQGNGSKKKTVSTYLDHSDNYKVENVKMVIVPPSMTDNSYPVVDRLYSEISKHNDVKQIVIVAENAAEMKDHEALLKDIMDVDVYNRIVFNEEDVSSGKNLEKYLQEQGSLAVVLADLGKGVGSEGDFLAIEMVRLAQKYSYRAHVFDVIDTQIARAVEKDYSSLFSFPQQQEEPLLNRQQRNLQMYVDQYKSILLKYFKQNLFLDANAESLWPRKSDETYRLYDRGAVYIRFFGDNNRELLARAKVGKNIGVIVSIIELARKASRKFGSMVKSFKIYLFTDFEAIDWDGESSLINYLETDDGVYMQYKNKNALLVADERPEDFDDLFAVLSNRARIPEDINIKDVKLYRFKTVEIEDEN